MSYDDLLFIMMSYDDLCYHYWSYYVVIYDDLCSFNPRDFSSALSEGKWWIAQPVIRTLALTSVVFFPRVSRVAKKVPRDAPLYLVGGAITMVNSD